MKCAIWGSPGKARYGELEALDIKRFHEQEHANTKLTSLYADDLGEGISAVKCSSTRPWRGATVIAAPYRRGMFVHDIVLHSFF
jgi:hypothetical protein